MESEKELLQLLYKLWTYYPHMSLCRLLSMVNENKLIDYVTNDMLVNKINYKLQQVTQEG